MTMIKRRTHIQSAEKTTQNCYCCTWWDIFQYI